MKKVLAILLSLVLTMGLLAACGQAEKPAEAPAAEEEAAEEEAEAPAEEAADGEMTILVMPKVVGIPWFNGSEEGAMAAAEDLGVNVIYAGPTTADATEQVKMIEDYLNQGLDAICIAPNDSAAVKSILQRAASEGVKVIDWDTPADKEDVLYSVNCIDYNDYAKNIWDSLVEAMGTDEGEYAIITGPLEAQNLNEWIAIGTEYAAEKYPNLKLVTDPVASDEQQQLAYQRALELIAAYPDLKGIIGISTPAPVGAAQAVQEKGLQDQIAVVGTAMPNDSKVYLKDGSMDICNAEADPAMLGYATVCFAKLAVEGTEITDGMDVEGVGTIRLLEDGKTIIMGSPLDVTAENVDNYNF